MSFEMMKMINFLKETKVRWVFYKFLKALLSFKRILKFTIKHISANKLQLKDISGTEV